MHDLIVLVKIRVLSESRAGNGVSVACYMNVLSRPSLFKKKQ